MSKEPTIQVTEAEYKEGLAKGWGDNDMLRPVTYKVRRATKFRQFGKATEILIDLDIDSKQDAA